MKIQRLAYLVLATAAILQILGSCTSEEPNMFSSFEEKLEQGTRDNEDNDSSSNFVLGFILESEELEEEIIEVNLQ